MRNLILIIFALFIFGCSKSAPELMNTAQHYLDQNDADKAIKDLNLLLQKFPNDSLASQAQYKLVNIYKNWKFDPRNVLINLKLTTDNYPNSIHSNRAQKEIDAFPEWIINNAESLRKRKMNNKSIDNLNYMIEKYPSHKLSSKAQYIIGDIFMNDLRDFDNALIQYGLVIENYSDSKEESLAQFMIGYIYANILNDFEKARKEYSKFISRFPNHELTPSVKFEVENLGKDINDIPALKHITS